MKVEILGTGCHNCLILEDLINEVLRDLGKTDAEVIRINAAGPAVKIELSPGEIHDRVDDLRVRHGLDAGGADHDGLDGTDGSARRHRGEVR